ncbi:MAG: hypothetical protein Q7S40_31095 [Opitutaceae bacterium]|nr:hypothetical protein [Opitutaceae bacterium]
MRVFEDLQFIADGSQVGTQAERGAIIFRGFGFPAQVQSGIRPVDVDLGITWIHAQCLGEVVLGRFKTPAGGKQRGEVVVGVTVVGVDAPMLVIVNTRTSHDDASAR